MKVVRETEEIESTLSYDIIAKTMRKVILDYSDRIMDKCPNAGLMR